MFSSGARPTPPRFATRTLIATLATVAFVLTAVLVVVTLLVRDHVRRSVVEKLETGQRLLATLEERKAEELRAQVGTLAENPTLMRMRELEVLEKIASAGHLKVVLGEKGLADRVTNLL